MEYYNLMILIGCCIIYIITNIYSVIIYIINTIKNGKFEDIIAAPLFIFMLLIPIIGTLFSFAIIDESNKYWQIAFYIEVYLILIVFAISMFMIF